MLGVVVLLGVIVVLGVVVVLGIVVVLGVVLGDVIVATDDATVLVPVVHVSAADLLAASVVVEESAALLAAHVFGVIAADGNRSLAHAKKSHIVPHPPTGNANRFSLIGL